MGEFAIVVLTDLGDGVTDEAVLECLDWTDVVNQLACLPFDEWKLVTVVHIEDLPRVMAGARAVV